MVLFKKLLSKCVARRAEIYNALRSRARVENKVTINIKTDLRENDSLCIYLAFVSTRVVKLR